LKLVLPVTKTCEDASSMQNEKWQLTAAVYLAQQATAVLQELKRKKRALLLSKNRSVQKTAHVFQFK